MPIITHLTDQDLYKFCMQQVVLHNFPDFRVKYKFKDRSNSQLGYLSDLVRDEIYALEHIKITPEELNYLAKFKFFSDDYLDFLRIFRYFPKEHIKVENINEELEISIEGPWLHTILYEIHILAIVSELFFNDKSINYYKSDVFNAGTKLLYDKLDLICSNQVYFDKFCSFSFADFGTRRRFSKEWALTVDKILAYEFDRKLTGYVGTSNVYNAMKTGVKPIGTMAHEFQQAMQTVVPPIKSIGHSLEVWSQEYRGSLGIALTDCLGIDVFLEDFDLYHAKLFDGVRHDSGDPDVWVEKIINHYKKLGIDPLTKTAVFSDGLNPEKAIELWKNWREQINVTFGIGTNLTNDMTRVADPLRIVLKMTECNGEPVAKICDSPGKNMCEDKQYIEYLLEKRKKINGKS